MSDIDQEIEERRAFLRCLTKLGELGDVHDAACKAEFAATMKRNAARKEYVRLWLEMESKFPNKTMPFYAESIWGAKKV